MYYLLCNLINLSQSRLSHKSFCPKKNSRYSIFYRHKIIHKKADLYRFMMTKTNKILVGWSGAGIHAPQSYWSWYFYTILFHWSDNIHGKHHAWQIWSQWSEAIRLQKQNSLRVYPRVTDMWLIWHDTSWHPWHHQQPPTYAQKTHKMC